MEASCEVLDGEQGLFWQRGNDWRDVPWISQVSEFGANQGAGDDGLEGWLPVPEASWPGLGGELPVWPDSRKRCLSNRR